MTIQENFESIRLRIAQTAQSVNRDSARISLVAVSKNQSAESIQAALQTGHRTFGENRVQEAEKHWSDLKKSYTDIKLHLIGPLQTNKIKTAMKLFDVIETIDREKLAQKLGEEMKEQNLKIPCLIQVNTGEEPQKAGIAPKDLRNFLSFCLNDCGLNITGLMCIPPVEELPALHFALLKKLAQENNLKELSMGMSADFEKAIALGATSVRIGTALFGARNQPLE